LVDTYSTRCYYKNARNTTWESDLKEWWSEEYMDAIGYAEITLDNADGDYSVGGANEIDADIQYVEIHSQRNSEGWYEAFRGFLYDIDHSKEGRVILKCGNAAWLLSKRLVYCWHRHYEDVLMGQITGYYSPSANGFAGDERTVYPTNFPYVGYAGNRNINHIFDTDWAGIEVPLWDIPLGSTLFDAFEQIRTFLGLIAQYIVDATGQLYVNLLDATDAQTDYNAHPPDEDHKFSLARGEPSADYQTLTRNGLRRTYTDYADRVVVVGQGDGVMGMFGEEDPAEAKMEWVVQDSSISTRELCNLRARVLYETASQQKWAGDVDIAFDPWYESSSPVGEAFKISDSKISDQDLYLYCVGVRKEFNKGTITLFFGENYRDVSKHFMETRFELSRLGDKSIGVDDAITCDKLTNEQMDMGEEGFYAILGDEIIAAANPGAPAGRLLVEWAVADDQPSSDLDAADFIGYIVEYGTIAGGGVGDPIFEGFKRCWRGATPGTDWDLFDDANLANIATTSTIITGLAAATWYRVRLWINTTKGRYLPFSEDAAGISS